MKTSKAFRLTLWKLWDGVGEQRKQRYICRAASCAGDSVFRIVEPIISSHFGRYIYLEDWLIEQGIDINDKHGTNNLPKLQATRKAWILHLIEHYESKGD